MSGARHHRRTAGAPVFAGGLKEETADPDVEKPLQRQYRYEAL